MVQLWRATLGQTLTQTAPEVTEGVNGLAQQLGGAIPTLQRCISNPSSCRAILGGGFSALTGVVGGTGLAVGFGHGVQSVQNVAAQNGGDRPTGTTTATVSASSISSSAEPTEWVIMTKEGLYLHLCFLILEKQMLNIVS